MDITKIDYGMDLTREMVQSIMVEYQMLCMPTMEQRLLHILSSQMMMDIPEDYYPLSRVYRKDKCLRTCAIKQDVE